VAAAKPGGTAGFLNPSCSGNSPRKRTAYGLNTPPPPHNCAFPYPHPPLAVSMSTSTKISPLRHLVNVLSDAAARIDETYASANLEFSALEKPFYEKDPAILLLSDPDVVPLASVVVAAADQLIVSARHPVQAVLDMARSVRTLTCSSTPMVCLGGRG